MSGPQDDAREDLEAAQRTRGEERAAAADPPRPAEPSGPVPLELRDVTFSTSMRGYDRAEVDHYVELVNRTIAELEVNRSPESAVKQALDRVGEQTARVLQQAREAAEELTATARAESEHAARRARVEAAELVEQAQERSQELLDRSSEESERMLERSKEQLGEIQAEIDLAQQQRERAIEQLRSIAGALEAFAVGAAEGGVIPAGAVPGPGEEPEDGASERGPDDPEQPTEVIRAVRGGATPATALSGAEDARERHPGRPQQPRAPRRDASKAWRAARG